MKILEFDNAKEALREMTEELVKLMAGKEIFNLALSGGTTAKRMFRFWVSEYDQTIDWERVRFYWVDERCVEPYEEDSNFCYARRLLFDPLTISPTQVFRIKGENNPQEEAIRYAHIVATHLPTINDTPHFDAIILGIGTDGHTASLFPGDKAAIDSESLYITSEHPVNHQKRVSMTPRLILNDSPLLVPMLGKDKLDIISMLHTTNKADSNFPAAFVLGRAKNATIYYSAD